MNAVLDFLHYLWEEIRNEEREEGWEDNEMTRLMAGVEEDRSEDTLVRMRRNFWRELGQ